ncbi:MAG: nitrogen fixation protein [Dehalococcoidia bacterium]
MRPDDEQQGAPLCPSARPGMDGAVIIGVMGGSAREPRLAHLVQPLPVVDEVLALAAPASPTAVFRFAAPCAGDACTHFAENRCRLATRIVEQLPEAVDGLPACRIRPDCRWWRQEGKAACLRCPMIVTETANPTDELREATDPTVYAARGVAYVEADTNGGATFSS